MQNKIFDICDTLYNSNTTMDFCEYRISGVLRILLKFSKSFLGKVINKFLLKFFHYDWIRILHIKTLKNIEISLIEKDAEDFVKSYLNNKKITEVHKYLKDFDKEEIILVSATIEPIAKAIAKSLWNLNYISTTLNINKNICQGTIKKDLLGNKADYFKNKKINFIITDNKSDLDLCMLAKEVVIVSKKKNLNFWKKQNVKITRIIEVD